MKWIKDLIFDPSALFEERIKVFTMSQLAQWRKNIFLFGVENKNLIFCNNETKSFLNFIHPKTH